MSRPCKSRKICALPLITEFGPCHPEATQSKEIIYMSLDEYETLRLIDDEDMTQEACALQMNIARTTAQKIYITARKKLVTMLLTGSILNIQGGRIVLCSENDHGAHCGRCRRNRGTHE